MMYIGNSGSSEEERSLGGAVNATRPKLDHAMGRGRPTGPNVRPLPDGHRASRSTRSMAATATTESCVVWGGLGSVLWVCSATVV